jgi:hypothetical protein
MAKTTAAVPRKKLTPEETEDLLGETRTLLQLWQQMRSFLLLAFQSEPIAREHEQKFLEFKSETARSQRVVSRKMPDDLQFGSDKITDFLRQAISVAHLRGLPLADKRGLVGTWHVASVMLHRAVGALEYISETKHQMEEQKSGLRGIRAIKSEAAATQKKSIVPVVVGVMVVAAVAAALYFLLFMQQA